MSKPEKTVGSAVIHETLAGKTVTMVRRGRCGEFVLVEFEDGTLWLLAPQRDNASGAKIEERVSWPHNGYGTRQEGKP